MTSLPRVLIAEPNDFSPRALALLAEATDVELRRCTDAEWTEAFRTYDVVWWRLAHRVSRSLLEQAGVRCRVVVSPVTGLDHIDLDACADHGVEVVSLRGKTEFLKEVRATAEFTIGLALALLRKVPSAFDSVRSGRWTRDPFRGHELFGKVAGVVGVGRLGTIVSGYLRSFGMDVLGYDPHSEFPESVATRVDSLEALFSRVDLVTIHVNLTPHTRGLITGRQLDLLKPGAVMVNTSRGAIVDDGALLGALESGRLGGAALDVLADEPNIQFDHSLVRYAREHDNLLLTPHIGGNTFESFEKTEIFLAQQVLEILGIERG